MSMAMRQGSGMLGRIFDAELNISGGVEDTRDEDGVVAKCVEDRVPGKV